MGGPVARPAARQGGDRDAPRLRPDRPHGRGGGAAAPARRDRPLRGLRALRAEGLSEPLQRRRRPDAPPEQVLSVDEARLGRDRPELMEVALLERIGLGRRQHDVGLPGARVGERRRGVALGLAAEHVHDAEGGQHRRPVRVGVHRHPRPSPDRDERRPRLTARGALGGWGRGRAGVDRDAHGSREDVEARPDVVDRVDVGHVHREPCRTQRFRILPAVLLVVHHHEVRRQRHDGSDVGILGATHRPQRRLLAEARHRHRLDPPGQQGLGDRRDQADHAHYSPSSLAFCASNSALVMVPRCSIPSSRSSWTVTSGAAAGGGGGIGVPPAAAVCAFGASDE